MVMGMLKRIINVLISLIIGFLVVYPLFLYGRHFIIIMVDQGTIPIP